MAPPIPGPKDTAPKGSARPSGRAAKESGGQSESSSARSAPRSRGTTATKIGVIEGQIATMYVMGGMAISQFGRFYPTLEPIGTNLATYSGEAAKAWADLAAKDARVLKVLESLTEASVWGNVIGIHLAIFAAALPGANLLGGQAQSQAPTPEDYIRQEGKERGMSDEAIADAIAHYRGTPAQTPARDNGTGGPGDTIRTGGEPVAPPVSTATGIVTPEQLGVVNGGEAQAFPADPSGPNGRGAV